MLGEYLVYLGKDLHYQANTLRRHVASLKSLFGFLTEAGYIAANPAANLVRPRIPRRQPRYLTREEVERLFQSVPGEGSFTARRDQTILMTMYYAGARVEEVVNINCRRERRRFLCLRKGRAKPRRVPPELGEQIKTYLEREGSRLGQYLFGNRNKERLTTEYVRQITRAYGEKAGIKTRVTPHMLRHSFATHLYRKGADILNLRRLLGHEKVQTTAVYVHSDIKHLQAAVARLPAPRRLLQQLGEGDLLEGSTAG